MTLDPNNDVYTGDLSILNVRKQAWSKSDEKSAKWRTLSYVATGVTLVASVFAAIKTYGGTTMASQMPLFITIWCGLLIIFLLTRKGRKISEQPFDGFHSARFEVDDDTVYYVYQKGMTLRTYYIHDKDIRRIIRDDESGVLLIQGDATINIQRRSGEDKEQVHEFYALVPFDKYDLDDLLAPYRKKVQNAGGKLRGMYDAERGQ